MSEKMFVKNVRTPMDRPSAIGNAIKETAAIAEHSCLLDCKFRNEVIGDPNLGGTRAPVSTPISLHAHDIAKSTTYENLEKELKW